MAYIMQSVCQRALFVHIVVVVVVCVVADKLRRGIGSARARVRIFHVNVSFSESTRASGAHTARARTLCLDYSATLKILS